MLVGAVEDRIWAGWRAGESLRAIAQATGSQRDVVRRLLAAHGGVRPPARRRDPRRLSVQEREAISRGLAAGLSCRQIASGLGRPASTVSREVARNGGRSAYRAVDAEAAALARLRRPKATKFAMNVALAEVVRGRLELDWSPQQITAWLTRTYADPEMRVSHETIYRSVYVAARRELGERAARHLRTGRTMRRPRMVRRPDGRGRLKNMTSIHSRPPEVAARTVAGHWEGDLVMGRRPSAVATLVERQTRYLRLVRLPDGLKADAVRARLAAELEQIPRWMRLSLTWDRGREMAEHQELTARSGTPVYFCDARSPWQRGTNENTNRLLRQYLGKSADLRTLTQRDLDDIAARINARPRRVLNWDSASERYLHLLRTRSSADFDPTSLDEMHRAVDIVGTASLGPLSS
ncbi:IS30 family transposase [Cellulomonas algicola]|uniref:IS30 family transposase n=1 Tax=Cellulomonas algicola TaxID=2071633 RepID=UPI001CECB8A3|nr:IS30 family transposase [Cellulomonas algicola]